MHKVKIKKINGNIFSIFRMFFKENIVILRQEIVYLEQIAQNIFYK